MAIDINKYVKIVSGKPTTNAAVRRNLIANVFTQNDAIAHRGMVSFTESDDVKEVFGSGSDEYKFATKYFGFVSKSITRADSLAFSSWNYEALDKQWRFYDVRVFSSGIAYVKEEGVSAETIYDSLPEVMSSLGDYSVIKIKLEGDVIKNSDASWNGGIKVGKNQHVYVDLNGYKFSIYNHCVTNEGFCRITDNTGNGCMWTTRTTNGVAYASNSSGVIYPSLSSTILSYGRLIIDNGWFGISNPTYSYTSVNYGPAVEIMGGEATINGGRFTCRQANVATGFNDVTYSFIATVKNFSRLTVNGGVFFGIPVGCLACDATEGVDTRSQFPAITVNGGSFYAGLPQAIATSTNRAWFCFAWSGQIQEFSLLPTSTPNTVTTCIRKNDGGFIVAHASLVSKTSEAACTEVGNYYYNSSTNTTKVMVDIGLTEINGALELKQSKDAATETGDYYIKEEFSVIDIRGGRFVINNTALIAKPDMKSGDRYNLFRGRVAVHKDLYYVHRSITDYNFNYNVADAFYNFRCTIPEYKRIEKPADALDRCDRADDNFGSFCFMENLTLEEIGELAETNASYNHKYLYSVDFAPDDCKRILYRVRGASGTCFTLDKFNAFARFMPMALFAATKYDRVNATKVFMYQQFDGERASVTTSQDADKYDAFDIDGQGTRFPVNYYGATQQAGSLINFYQDGYNADGLDTACYCNEIWLKDAISVELLNTFIALEKIPADNVGEAIVRNAIISVLNEGIRNEAITTGKTLDNVQRAYVDRVAGEANAWENVETYGYWIDTTVKHRTLAGGKVQYYADYALVYSKGDAIRKVEGSDILI